MIATLVLAGAMATSSVPTDKPTIPVTGDRDRIEVGYHELLGNRPADAIARIHSNDGLEPDEPAALINLGTAHARLGQTSLARRYYNAAILSGNRYDLELADGRWMDSRAAARLAISMMAEGRQLALR